MTEINGGAASGRLTREIFEAGGLVVSWEPAAPLPVPVTVDTDLDHIAARINTALEAGEVMTRNALRLFLDAGANLIAAKERVPAGEWEGWLSKNCSRIKKREAQIYMQLARRRDDIEYELKKCPDLSLRVARRLIMENGGRQSGRRQHTDKRVEPETPDWAVTFEQSSGAEKTAGLTSKRVRDMFAHMPAAVRDELADLVLGNAAEHAPTKKQRNAIRRAQKQPYLELTANPTNT
jgi:hypothetical protein